MNNYLILRSENSPYNDVTKNSVLSFADMDSNLLFLKGNIIYTAITNGGIVTLKKYNGEDITYIGGGSGTFTGGTITGPTTFIAGLTANTINTNTISASTLILNGVAITSLNNYVTGGTYNSSNGTLTLNTGSGGILVTGFTSGSGTFSGGTVINPTNFTGGLSANTFSATTYLNLPKDVYVTGGTYSNGTTTFRNNNGDTFSVTGFTNGGSSTFTGGTVSGYTEFQNGVNTNSITATVYYNLPTDIYISGGTYSNGSAIFTNTTGGTFTINGFNISSFTGGTITGATNFTGGLTANTINSTTISATTYLGIPISLTGGSYSNGAISFINSTGGTLNITIPSNYAAGVISGASGWSKVVPNNGQINLPAIKVALYNNANNIEPIAIYDVASGTTGVGAIPALTDNDTNYIVVEYNGGTPRYNVYLSDSSVDDSSVVLYMVVYRLGNFVHTLEFGNQGAGLANKLNDRFIMTDRFGYETGLALGLSGSTGVVTLTAGVAWNGPNRQSLNACDSSGNTFFKNYHVGGAWTATTSSTTTGRTMNNTFYDNGTDIVSGTTGKFLTNWYYRGQEINDHLYEVYSTSQYDSAILAEAASQPSLPELITSHAFLVGRIIVGVGATTGVTQTAFGPVFQSSNNYSSTSVHNDLTGLQGGTAGQYYHLTAAQYNNLALTTSANTFTQQQTFNGGLSATSMSATSLFINGVIFTGDTYATGFTYSNNTFTVKQTNGDLSATINTMTGLTVNGNITFTGQSNNPVYSAGSGTFTGAQTEITLDFNSSSIQHIVLTGTTKFNSPLNIKNGAIYTLIVKQNAVGGWNVNWFTPTFKWENGTLPAITTTANAVDLITFISDGTTLYGIIAKNFS